MIVRARVLQGVANQARIVRAKARTRVGPRAATGHVKPVIARVKVVTGRVKAVTGRVVKVLTDRAKAATDHAKAATGRAKAATGHAKAATDHAKAAIGHVKAATGRGVQNAKVRARRVRSLNSGLISRRPFHRIVQPT